MCPGAVKLGIQTKRLEVDNRDRAQLRVAKSNPRVRVGSLVAKSQDPVVVQQVMTTRLLCGRFRPGEQGDR